MKKIVLILLLASSSMIVSAQLQKGNLLLGGGFGFAVSNGSQESKYLSGDFEPRIGWFLNNHSVSGVELGYKVVNLKSTNPPYFPISKRTTNNFSVMPFYRRYFPIGEKAALFLHGKAGVSFGGTKYYDERMDDNGELISSQSKSQMFSGGAYISPGIALFITPKFSIEAMISTLSYLYIKNKPEEGEDYTGNSFEFTLNSFTFGTTWYFSKK